MSSDHLDLALEIFEHAPDGIFVADASGRFTHANPRACELLGCRLEQLRGRLLGDIVEPAELESRPIEFERLMSGEVLTRLRTLLRADGTAIEVELTARRLPDGRFLSIARDFSERRAMELELRERERRHRALFDNMAAAGMVYDVVYDDAGVAFDLRLADVNSAFERMMQAGAETLVGRRLREVAPETAGEWLPILLEVERTGQPFSRIERHGLRDLYYDTRAYRPRPRQVAVQMLDVSDLKRSEENLLERDAWLDGLVNNVLDALITIDERQRIVLFNPAAERMFRCSAKAVLGERLDRFLPARFRDMHEAYVREFGASGIVSRRMGMTSELFAVRADGEEFPIEGSISQTTVKGRRQFTVLLRDSSERKRAEAERLKFLSQIQQTQKLESLGVLAGGIAHDFNNLLMAVLGHADLALDALPPSSVVRDDLDEIRKAAQRATELCKQMLAYSGKGRFVIAPIRLPTLVEDMRNMLRISISKNAVIKSNFAADTPAVDADASQLRQVVMNLIINASEAIGDRAGVITLSTGAMNCDRAYLSESWLDEGLPEGVYVYMEVADTGCGMDADTRSRIFDPFFTTKFTGRGLGLAAVLGIVRGHRGAIKVYSEPGQGTTFKVLFPASARGELAEDEIPSEQNYRGRGVVLLVDDDESVRSVGRKMLERLGFSVVTAADGAEAIARFRERSEEIACAIVDLTMPHVDGAETFRELRRIKPSVRVILSSGYNEQDVTQRFVGKGLAGFIQKPYQLATLVTVLKDVVVEDRP